MSLVRLTVTVIHAHRTVTSLVSVYTQSNQPTLKSAMSLSGVQRSLTSFFDSPVAGKSSKKHGRKKGKDLSTIALPKTSKSTAKKRKSDHEEVEDALGKKHKDSKHTKEWLAHDKGDVGMGKVNDRLFGSIS
jgi:hypothetical protein